VQRQYALGDFVLLRFPRPGKLELGWEGPFLVKGQDDAAHNVYMCESLVDGRVDRVHVSRMHFFVIGNLSQEALRAEAAPDEVYLVEKVLGHEILSDKELRFFVV
jgi:hypothetical protein